MSNELLTVPTGPQLGDIRTYLHSQGKHISFLFFSVVYIASAYPPLLVHCDLTSSSSLRSSIRLYCIWIFRLEFLTPSTRLSTL